LAEKHDPVLVVGLGRFGRSLALALVAEDTDVLVIDRRADLAQRFANRLDNIVIGDATDIDLLREVGAEQYQRAVVAIGDDEHASILATSHLSELGVERIWAKANSGTHARILDRVGAHHVIFPEDEMGRRVAHLVGSHVHDYLPVDPTWAAVITKPGRSLIGEPLRDLRALERQRVRIVSVRHAQSTQYTHAEPDTVLQYGDHILVTGHPEDLTKFLHRT
jgi:trk system potassium uptake protein TrkA